MKNNARLTRNVPSTVPSMTTTTRPFDELHSFRFCSDFSVCYMYKLLNTFDLEREGKAVSRRVVASDTVFVDHCSSDDATRGSISGHCMRDSFLDELNTLFLAHTRFVGGVHEAVDVGGTGTANGKVLLNASATQWNAVNAAPNNLSERSKLESFCGTTGVERTLRRQQFNLRTWLQLLQAKQFTKKTRTNRVPSSADNTSRESILVVVDDALEQVRGRCDLRRCVEGNRMLCHEVSDVIGNSLCVCSRSRAATVDVVMDWCQFVGNTVGNIRSGGGARVSADHHTAINAVSVRHGHDGGSC